MNGEKIYIIYCLVVLLLTIYFSFKIIWNKSNYTGQFFLKIKGKDEEELIGSLIKFQQTKEVCESEIRNSLGFKDYEWREEKPNNTYRILTFGDSWTYGFCVETNHTWPKQLEKLLNERNPGIKFEVFNMGSREHDRTYTQLQLLRKVGLNYSPDMVILQYCFNDWESPESVDKARELWGKYLSGEYKLPERVKKFIDESNINVSDEGASRIIVEIVLRDYYSSVDPAEEWEKWVKRPLIEMDKLLKERNIKFIIITWSMTQPFLWQKERLEKLSKELNIPFYDLTEYIPETHPSEFRFADYHLTSKGYEIVANRTLEIVLKNMEMG